MRRLAALLAVVLCAACSASSSPSSPATSPGSPSGAGSGSEAPVPSTCTAATLGTPPAAVPPAAPAGTVTTPGGPVGLLAQGNGLWVAVPPANQVARLDLATRSVTGSVPVSAVPLRLAAAGGGIWVTEFGNGTVARFDPGTLRVTCRVTVGDQPEGITTDGSTVWIVLEAPHALAELDGATGAVRRTIALPADAQPRLALLVDGTVWVADYQGNRLFPVDASTGRVGPAVTGCAHPQGLDVAAGKLWVACLGTQEVVAVRLTGAPAVVTRVKVPGDPDGVHADGGRLYVALSNGPGVRVLDVATGKLGAPVQLGTHGPLSDANIDVLTAGGDVWVTSFDELKLYHRPAASITPR